MCTLKFHLPSTSHAPSTWYADDALPNLKVVGNCCGVTVGTLSRFDFGIKVAHNATLY